MERRVSEFGGFCILSDTSGNAELETFNQGVKGSNPFGLTSKINGLLFTALPAFF
jgi:hypothetical protein